MVCDSVWMRWMDPNAPLEMDKLAERRPESGNRDVFARDQLFVE